MRNLVTLCTFHHKLVHEGGYTVQRIVISITFLIPQLLEIEYESHFSTTFVIQLGNQTEHFIRAN